MKMTNTLKAFGIVTAGLVGTLFGGTSAQAATIVQTETFGVDIPNYTETLTFDKYVAPVGHEIKSIQVKMMLDIDGGVLIVDNDGVDEAAVTVKLGAAGSISSTDVSLLDTASNPLTADVSAENVENYLLSPDDGDGPLSIDPNTPDGRRLDGEALSDSASGMIHASTFGEYTSLVPETFDILVDIRQILDFGSIGGVEGTFAPVNAGGYVELTYITGKIVPVPAASLVGMSLLGGLGVARKFRKRA